MTERLRFTLDEEKTTREHVEAVVRSVGYGIAAEGPVPERQGVRTAGKRKSFQRSQADFEPRPRTLLEALQPPDRIARSLPGIRLQGPSRHWHRTAAAGVAWAVNLLASDEVARWAFVLATLIGVAPMARRAVSAGPRADALHHRNADDYRRDRRAVHRCGRRGGAGRLSLRRRRNAGRRRRQQGPRRDQRPRQSGAEDGAAGSGREPAMCPPSCLGSGRSCWCVRAIGSRQMAR